MGARSNWVAGKNAEETIKQEEAIKQAAEALSKLTKGTPAAMTIKEAELRIKQIQISAAQFPGPRATSANVSSIAEELSRG